MPTRTATLPIAFRQLYSEWNKDRHALLPWAKSTGFEAIDLLGEASPADLAAVRAAELRLGTVDLIEMGKLLTSDAGFRNDLIARNVAYVPQTTSAVAP